MVNQLETMRTDKAQWSSLNSLAMVTKYTPPCCRARYVCYVKQNKLAKQATAAMNKLVTD